MVSSRRKCKTAEFAIFMLYLLTCYSTKRKFGDEYFRFFLFMVLVQCIVNAVFARIGQLWLKYCNELS